jgi:hypothetical protein
MTLKPREVRALAMLPLGVLAVLILYRITSTTPAVAPVSGTPEMLELRLRKLRQLSATVPGREQVLKVVQGHLALREKGVLQFSTAPQAQAHVLEVARRIASANKIEARGGDFSAPHLLGADYGEVSVGVSFECAIDQFMNFLADLSKEPELISPAEVHVAAANLKNKTINVRLVLAGVVAKKLVPEKKNSLL